MCTNEKSSVWIISQHSPWFDIHFGVDLGSYLKATLYLKAILLSLSRKHRYAIPGVAVPGISFPRLTYSLLEKRMENCWKSFMCERPTKNEKVCVWMLAKQRFQVHTMPLNQLTKVNFVMVRAVKLLDPLLSNVLIEFRLHIKWSISLWYAILGCNGLTRPS